MLWGLLERPGVLWGCSWDVVGLLLGSCWDFLGCSWGALGGLLGCSWRLSKVLLVRSLSPVRPVGFVVLVAWGGCVQFRVDPGRPRSKLGGDSPWTLENCAPVETGAQFSKILARAAKSGGLGRPRGVPRATTRTQEPPRALQERSKSRQEHP